MEHLENELGGVYVHVPDGAKINTENKNAPPPEVVYEEQRATFDLRVTKKLCGGRYERDNN